MEDQSAIARNALYKAINLADGVGNLSRELAIPQKDLLRFAGGEAPIPQGVFLRLVDYILDERHGGTVQKPDGYSDGKPGSA